MKSYSFFLSCFIVTIWGLPAWAGLDFDQEVITIPNTHDFEAYLWEAMEDPSGLTASIQGQDDGHTYTVRFTGGPSVSSLEAYITDPEVREFYHENAIPVGRGIFAFSFSPATTGKKLVELVGKTDTGTVVHLRKTLKVEQTLKTMNSDQPAYTVTEKHFPEEVYADHVVTFVFSVKKGNNPVFDLGDGKGEVVHGAGWRRGGFLQAPGDFVPAFASGGGTGPEIAVSMVFRESGNHRIFMEFNHQGAIYRYETELLVLREPKHAANRQPWE